ncbi:hypothetical protein ElyMa_000177100 [Elysia marginata]|uniref:Uncharacterized protein n=1 Tax=Elysia marginata TaxID=1093978 RepID=A0AAV4EVB5_9GAST|nr:hypothetical protein ElyMa_000177100 [Elysia marginata]
MARAKTAGGEDEEETDRFSERLLCEKQGETTEGHLLHWSSLDLKHASSARITRSSPLNLRFCTDRLPNPGRHPSVQPPLRKIETLKTQPARQTLRCWQRDVTPSRPPTRPGSCHLVLGPGMQTTLRPGRGESWFITR